MSKSLLITRPSYDLVTNYFCVWSDTLVAFAQEKMIRTYDLKADKANKGQFESYIKAHKPSFIFLNGHGNAQIITGHNNETLIDALSTAESSIMYARSCEAALVLGNELVKKNVKTFIGYTRKFIFGYTPIHASAPLSDDLAKLFLEPSNSIGTILLKGHTAQEAHNRSRTAMYKNFRKMISSTASYEERFAARWLWSNLKSQILLGNKSQAI
jgi:hypothetical protein